MAYSGKSDALSQALNVDGQSDAKLAGSVSHGTLDERSDAIASFDAVTWLRSPRSPGIYRVAVEATFCHGGPEPRRGLCPAFVAGPEPVDRFATRPESAAICSALSFVWYRFRIGIGRDARVREQTAGMPA